MPVLRELFACDNCYGVCPDNAVIKLDVGGPYAIDYDYCKGWGICVVECPCGAIEMEPEGTALRSAHGSVQQVVARLIVIGELYLDLAELAGAPMSW